MNTVEQTEEFEKWLDGLKDAKAQKLVVKEIVKMQGGLFGDAKSVGDGVYEARLHYGPGYRLYYTQRGSAIYLLLCGGTKRKQQKDIDKAIELAAQL